MKETIENTINYINKEIIAARQNRDGSNTDVGQSYYNGYEDALDALLKWLNR